MAKLFYKIKPHIFVKRYIYIETCNLRDHAPSNETALAGIWPYISVIYIFVHLSYKTIFVDPLVVLNHRFHCIFLFQTYVIWHSHIHQWACNNAIVFHSPTTSSQTFHPLVKQLDSIGWILKFPSVSIW